MEFEYTLFVLSIFLSCMASIMGGFYNKKVADLKNTSMLYTFLKLVAIAVFWIVRFGIDNFAYDLAVLPYALGFAVCFFGGVYGLIGALQTGSNAISSLSVNATTVVVSIWGILFWNEPMSNFVLIGLPLVLLAFFLCLYTGKGEKKKTRPIWFLYLAINFFSNAGCSILFNQQRITFQDQYGPFFMMTAISLCAVVSGVLFFCSNKSEAKVLLKRAWYYPVLDGLSNGLMNMIQFVLLASTLSINILFPVRGIIGLILITLFSALIFKERMRWWQWLGMALGIAATGILSL